MGHDTKNLIDINGKRYDAVTGTYIGASPAPPKPSGSAAKSLHSGSIDGFRRVSRSQAAEIHHPVRAAAKPAQQRLTTPKPLAKTPVPALFAVSDRKPHSPAVHAQPHSPQPASTLMRSAVKKPVIKSPAVIKAQTRTDLLAHAPLQTVAPKISYNSVNKVRHQRAERMIKSPAVSRYSKENGALAGSSATFAAAQPAARPVQHYNPHPGSATMSEMRPAAAAVPRIAVQPQRPHAAAHPSSKPDIFEQALADARSHEETYQPVKHRTKKRRPLLRFAMGSLVALLLAGFFAYQNVPQLSLKVASYRAGLSASMPANQPSGFQFGYLDYKPGNVTVNYTSPADSRQFNITQKASSWDSQALLSNFVASANSAYKTYSRAGRTVYLIGNNTATWVDSGIWYTVDGNSSLSTKQVLDLASSM